MKSVSARIWTRIAMSISYDDNKFYGISTIVGYLIPNPLLYLFVALFQTSHFNIFAQFSYIWHIDRYYHSWTHVPGSDSNKGVISIP